MVGIAKLPKIQLIVGGLWLGQLGQMHCQLADVINVMRWAHQLKNCQPIPQRQDKLDNNDLDVSTM